MDSAVWVPAFAGTTRGESALIFDDMNALRASRIPAVAVLVLPAQYKHCETLSSVFKGVLHFGFCKELPCQFFVEKSAFSSVHLAS